MMSSDFFFRNKIPVAVLGGTTAIGQELVQLLARHPWFEIVALCDSEPFIGQLYRDVVTWHTSLPENIAKMPLQACEPLVSSSIIFSGLHYELAQTIEPLFAEAGYFVVSHFPYQWNLHIPQIVANVNPNHLTLIDKQDFAKGRIVSTPHSLIIELTLALKPLMDQFGLEEVQVVALQTGSKLFEEESLRILGKLQAEEIQNPDFKFRTQFVQGVGKENLTDISIKLRNRGNSEQLIQAWRQFASGAERLQLPTAPFHPLSYFHQIKDIPLPNQQVHDRKESIKIVNLSPSSHLDYQFTLIPSPIIPLIAESALLNAELLVAQGKIYW